MSLANHYLNLIQPDRAFDMLQMSTDYETDFINQE